LAYYLDAIDEQATEHEGVIFLFCFINLGIISYKLPFDHGTETVDIFGVHWSFHLNSEFGEGRGAMGIRGEESMIAIEWAWAETINPIAMPERK
jgi:hypothetical protein